MQRALQPHALQPAGVHPVESMRRVPSMPPSYIDMITRQVMRDPVVLKVRRTSTTCDMQQAAYNVTQQDRRAKSQASLDVPCPTHSADPR